MERNFGFSLLRFATDAGPLNLQSTSNSSSCRMRNSPTEAIFFYLAHITSSFNSHFVSGISAIWRSETPLFEFRNRIYSRNCSSFAMFDAMRRFCFTEFLNFHFVLFAFFDRRDEFIFCVYFVNCCCWLRCARIRTQWFRCLAYCSWVSPAYVS